MSEKIRGIVLNLRKYNDRNSIVTLYTRQRGRLSFITPLGSGKSSNARRAKLQPLSVIETEIKYKVGQDLQRLSSIESPLMWKDIYFHPAKRAISLFISEFLFRLLNETSPDERIYRYIEESLQILDGMQAGISDFHIVFLVGMLSFSGIMPDTSEKREGYVFEFASGSFQPEWEATGPVIKGEETEMVSLVTRLNYRNMKYIRWNGDTRRQVLYALLNYYSYHFPGLGSLKSPEILRELFG